VTLPVRLRNGGRLPRAEVPRLPVARFRQEILDGVQAGGRIAALFGLPAAAGDLDLVGVLAFGASGELGVAGTRVGDRYPALTPDCPQAHAFEREIAEQWGVLPEGHPWLKPIRFPPASRAAGSRASPRQAATGWTDFFRVEGEEVHEVAVGPVHAGVIEPGHFRFQCHGEQVAHLEISLGYQHRGVERAMVGGPSPRTLAYVETLAGDTSVGHALAYCWNVEALAGCPAAPRVEAIRGVALELERLANHTGDLGALAGDVGYLPTASFCGRLRGEFLNMTALLCGSRFGRGLVRPGGVAFDVDQERSAEMRLRADITFKAVASAADLLWHAPSVMARFDGTGAVPRAVCDELGLVGMAARACGVDRDVRRDFPAGFYRFAQIPVSTWHTGDVFARAYVRWLEVQRSARFLDEQLGALPRGDVRRELGPLRPDALVVSLVEGWRGELCHVALTGGDGRFAQYRIVDPSFRNWIGLALALRNQQISDFPALQQELQPLVLRSRSVTGGLHVEDDPSQISAGPSHDALSRRSAAGTAAALRGRTESR